MSNDIITQWLNLPQVSVRNIDIVGNSTIIYLKLDNFFCEIGKGNAKNICAIATDMWDPYLASICQYAPQAKIVFDKFCLIAEYNRMMDRIRNEEYGVASGSGKNVIAGSRYLLLTNKENLGKYQKERLRELLDVNKTISTAYILKDKLKMLW